MLGRQVAPATTASKGWHRGHIRQSSICLALVWENSKILLSQCLERNGRGFNCKPATFDFKSLPPIDVGQFPPLFSWNLQLWWALTKAAVANTDSTNFEPFQVLPPLVLKNLAKIFSVLFWAAQALPDMGRVSAASLEPAAGEPFSACFTIHEPQQFLRSTAKFSRSSQENLGLFSFYCKK